MRTAEAFRRASVPTTLSGSSPPSRPRKQAAADVVRLIAATSLVRLVLAAALGLGVDESYAIAVARPLSLSYFDHPPLAFWIAGLASRLTDERALLRLPFIALFAATTWLVYRLTATLFDERAGLFAAVVLSLAPVFSVSTGGWILPDGPLFFGEALAALAAAHLAFDAPGTAARQRARWLWFAVGSSVAELSKYHAVLFFAGMIIWCVMCPAARRWLRRPEPWMAVAVIAAAALPILVWNGRHEWVSIRFQLGRSTGAPGSSLSSLFQSVLGQASYLLPWVWLVLVAQLGKGLLTGPHDERRWLCVCLAAPPILVFTLAALGGRPGLPHWPAPGYLFLVPLAGAWLADCEARLGRRRVRQWLLFAGIGFAAPLVLVVSQATTGWMNRVAPSLFRHGDPSADLVDWRSGIERLSRDGALNGVTVVVGTHWIDAAKLAYAFDSRIPVRCASDDPRHFRFLPPVLPAGDTLVVVRADSLGRPAPGVRIDVARAHLADVVPMMRAGTPVFYLAAFRIGEVRRR